jgi:ABC-type multidrug transport system ATPase subunit
VSLTVRRGDRLGIIGPNGIGKSTLLKIAVGEIEPDSGSIQWGYEAHPGYFAQDQGDLLKPRRQSAEAWLWQACPGETIGFVRSNLAKVLLTGDDVKKRVGTLSGGEGARLIFARLAVEEPNVLVLDEPTNHLDLESIEALVEGLGEYPGTLILVSHDRWFVSRLATRIVEITSKAIRDYEGTYEEYVAYCGDDHLDAEVVLDRERRERRKAKKARGKNQRHENRQRIKVLIREHDQLTEEIERAEARIHEINETFCDPTFFTRTPSEEVGRLKAEQEEISGRLSELMKKWEQMEAELESLES